MRAGVTERQEELLQFIYEYMGNAGYAPTLEEMRDGLGVVSNQAVLDLLKRLEEKNLVLRDSSARSLRITQAGCRILGRPFQLAYLGVTQAGAPVEMVEIKGEWELAPSSDVAKFQGEVSLLKVFGDSMVSAGIEEEDMVLVQRQKEFVSGDIVFARIGDGSTVKRFISDDRPPYIYLKPESPNPQHKPIPFTEDTEILGKVISVLKGGRWAPLK